MTLVLAKEITTLKCFYIYYLVQVQKISIRLYVELKFTNKIVNKILKVVRY
jgi:hypothetical protein